VFNLICLQVRRRRYFENSVDEKKRRLRDSRMKAKRNRQFPPRTYDQAVAEEPAPFSDMFGTPDDIFADVLVGDGAPSYQGRRDGAPSYQGRRDGAPSYQGRR